MPFFVFSKISSAERGRFDDPLWQVCADLVGRRVAERLPEEAGEVLRAAEADREIEASGEGGGAAAELLLTHGDAIMFS